MSDAVPGERTYLIDATDVNLPAGLQLIRAIPPGVRFVFEPRERRTVPVEARFTEAPAKFRVIPSSLTIEGPESHVHNVHTLFTDKIDIATVKGKGSFHATALANDPHVRITSDPDVTVDVWK
jgi:hypothetical protein